MATPLPAKAKPFSEHHARLFEVVLVEGSYTYTAQRYGLKPDRLRAVCYNVAQVLLELDRWQHPQATLTHTEITMASFKQGKDVWEERLKLYHRLQGGLAHNAL